jgi:hypothetical protein
MFDGEARAYPRVDCVKSASPGQAIALPSGYGYLAYSEKSSITDEKSFMRLTPGASQIKLFWIEFNYFYV